MTLTYLPRQIEIGKNSLERLGKIASEMGAKKLFVIMDAFLTSPQLSYDQKIREIALPENLSVTFFSDYQGEPTSIHVEEALKKLSDEGSDCVVAVGGGSAIDIAKAVSLFGANPQLKWEEITNKVNLNRLSLIAIPTTAGTGSEATKVMVITDVKTQLKMNPGHKDLIPDVSILDPLLTQSLPPHFTAYTGMDALTHAIEAYISTKASVITDYFAITAIESIGKSLSRVYENGNDLAAREEMLLASCYAGIAFSNASTNLAHAIGRSLGARFKIPHGLSVSLVLPLVMRFGLDATEDRYLNIGAALGVEKTKNQREMAESTIQFIEEMNTQFSIWKDGLKYIDPKELKDKLSPLVADSLSGNGISTNQIVPKEKDIKEILILLMEKLNQVSKTEAAAL